MPIRTLIADDHQLFREGLRSLIEEQSGIEVVGEADNGRSAVALVRRLHPDVVIMDVAMPELNGIEATRQILDDNDEVKVLALSMYIDRRYVTQMLKAGARGYMIKDSAFEELSSALETVSNDKTYLSPQVQQLVVDEATKGTGADELLTGREREVLQLIAEGHDMKAIADQLFIAVKTAESHRRQIQYKLNTRSIAMLTKYAILAGLTTLDARGPAAT